MNLLLMFYINETLLPLLPLDISKILSGSNMVDSSFCKTVNLMQKSLRK